MGIWRFAGAFAVVERQGECGSNDREMHVSQPMNIGVCYQPVVFFSFRLFRFQPMSEISLVNRFLFSQEVELPELLQINE